MGKSDGAQLAKTLADYQRSGGVYLVTESNNIFNRSSVLNAMPSISPQVDKDLWLSVVMVAPAKRPEGDSATAQVSPETLNGKYFTPDKSLRQNRKRLLYFDTVI